MIKGYKKYWLPLVFAGLWTFGSIPQNFMWGIQREANGASCNSNLNNGHMYMYIHTSYLCVLFKFNILYYIDIIIYIYFIYCIYYNILYYMIRYIIALCIRCYIILYNLLIHGVYSEAMDVSISPGLPPPHAPPEILAKLHGDYHWNPKKSTCLVFFTLQ